jgi:hypothetical protein
MGGGKTSFLVPLLIYGEMMDVPRTGPATRLIVPEALVAQANKVVSDAMAVFGIRRPTHTPNLQHVGGVKVVGDKELQRRFLDTTGGGVAATGQLATFMGTERWNESLVICDEIDRVIDPLSCVTNQPIGVETQVPKVRFFFDPGTVFDDVPQAARAELMGFVLNSAPSRTSALGTKLEGVKNLVGGVTDKKLALGVDYGLLMDDAEDDVMTAVPYAAANTPRKKARFTDLELRLALTCNAYRDLILTRRAFRPRDAKFFVDRVRALAGGFSAGNAAADAFAAVVPGDGPAAEEIVSALARHAESGTPDLLGVAKVRFFIFFYEPA